MDVNLELDVIENCIILIKDHSSIFEIKLDVLSVIKPLFSTF